MTTPPTLEELAAAECPRCHHRLLAHASSFRPSACTEPGCGCTYAVDYRAEQVRKAQGQTK